ncbi:ABC transport permease subunit MlaE [Planctomycetes bacterium Pan216]|uniref:ABC transport permease subunit MlaE n=1 Tax=Kolteria novifilia TaxID=2527975 RepID=A0A518B5M3_9BACT|nr:ABC transport permease subunit MlaE [Planctomycetes bacterium Pan216]
MATVSSQPTPLEQLGSRTIGMISTLGDLISFCGQLALWMTTTYPRKRLLVPTFYQIGVRSVPVVAITGTFIGMVLAVQAYNQFAQMGLQTRLGSVINVSLVTELGPVLAATMLAGRIGGAMAAEIGTMKVTEQVDALRCLGVNPIRYLVVPRFLACVVLIPLLTVMADFMGVIGGALVSIKIMKIDAFYYWMHSRGFVGLWEVFTGLFKSLFFGAEIAIISCHRGFRSGAGAEGVGRSATEAFVYSFIAILASDFMLGILLNGIYNLIWPGQSASIGN